MKTGPHSKDLPWLVSTWVALACFHLGMTHTCLEQSHHLSSLCSRISEEKISPKRLWLPSRLVGGLWGWIKFLNTAITEHIWYVFNWCRNFWCNDVAFPFNWLSYRSVDIYIYICKSSLSIIHIIFSLNCWLDFSSFNRVFWCKNEFL